MHIERAVLCLHSTDEIRVKFGGSRHPQSLRRTNSIDKVFMGKAGAPWLSKAGALFAVLQGGGTAMGPYHHVRWHDISSNEVPFSLGAVAKISRKGGEGSAFEVTTTTRGFLALTGVCSVHRVVAQ